MALLAACFDYIATLWNLWLWLAAGVLTLNEVSGKFFGWSWELPRHHRFKAVVVVLLVAQIGAYQGAKQEASRIAIGASADRLAHEEAIAKLNKSIGEVNGKLEERDRRISDLQTFLAQRLPLVVPPPAVNVYQGSGGPLPTYPLGGSDSSYWGYENDVNWHSISNSRAADLNWQDIDDATDVFVVARTWDTKVRGRGELGKARVRLMNSLNQSVAVVSDWFPTGEPFNLRVKVPRPKNGGPASYRLEAAPDRINTIVAFTEATLVLERRRE